MHGSGKCPGERNGNPLQISCMGSAMDRGAQWDTIHGVTGVEHQFATKPPPPKQYTLKPLLLPKGSKTCSNPPNSTVFRETKLTLRSRGLLSDRLRSDFHPWCEKRLPIFPCDLHQADCTNNTARLPHPVTWSALSSPASCLTEAEPCGPHSSAC